MATTRGIFRGRQISSACIVPAGVEKSINTSSRCSRGKEERTGKDGRMEQLGFEGMPRRLYACTPTRLSTWLDCPRRYRMSYLDRPAPSKGPPWAHNSLGASVHNALAGWWRLPLRQRTVTAAGDLLDSGWLSDGFADGTQSQTHRRRWRPLVEGYVSDLDPAAEPDAEQGLSFLAHNLRAAHDAGNPFLSSPDELEEAGFVGVPYVIPT